MRSFDGIAPRFGEDVYIAPGAVVVGDVVLGRGTSVWYGAVIRGDVNWIRVGERVNIQDGTVIHVVRRAHPTLVGDDVTLGHNVVLHGCTVAPHALIGIGALVLDGASIGEEAMVGAGAVVTPGTRIPPRVLALGTPARVIRELTDQELAYNQETAANYCRLARLHREGRDVLIS